MCKDVLELICNSFKDVFTFHLSGMTYLGLTQHLNVLNWLTSFSNQLHYRPCKDSHHQHRVPYRLCICSHPCRLRLCSHPCSPRHISCHNPCHSSCSPFCIFCCSCTCLCSPFRTYCRNRICPCTSYHTSCHSSCTCYRTAQRTIFCIWLEF